MKRIIKFTYFLVLCNLFISQLQCSNAPMGADHRVALERTKKIASYALAGAILSLCAYGTYKSLSPSMLSTITPGCTLCNMITNGAPGVVERGEVLTAVKESKSFWLIASQHGSPLPSIKGTRMSVIIGDNPPINLDEILHRHQVANTGSVNYSG